MAAWLRDELSRLLQPLTVAAASPVATGTLLRSLGYTSDAEANGSLRDELVRLADLATDLAALDPGTLDTWDGLAALLGLGRELFDAMRGIEAVNDPSLADQMAELGRILVEQLLSLHLRARYPAAFRVACLLRLVTPAEARTPLPPMRPSGELVRLPVLRDELHLDRVGALFEDPGAVLRDAYYPGRLATAADAHEAASRVFPVLQELLGALGFRSAASLMNLVPADPPPESPLPYDPVVDGDADWPEPDEQPEEPGDPPAVDLGPYYLEHRPRLEIALPGIPDENGEPTPGLWGLSVVASAAEHPDGIRGYLVGPVGSFDCTETRGGWQLTAQASGALPAFVIGPDGVVLAVGAPGTGADVEIAVERIAGFGEPAFQLGAPDGSHVALSEVRVSARGTLRPERVAVAIAVDLDDAVLVITPGDGDGFLGRILPAGGLRVPFDLGLVFSSDRGLQLRVGGGGLTLPVNLEMGPLRVESVELTVDAEADGASVAVAGNVALTLGPVTAEVTGLGLRGRLTFPEEGGNLGPADLAIGFEPPSGSGLAIDASAVRGGGFLSREGERYTGALALDALGVALMAYGVLDAAGDDYSLAAVVSAQFSQVQLGLGFTLEGVGGLIGVNRRMDVDAVRAALDGGGVGDLFFPADPVAQAGRLTGDLGRFFPAAEGRHVIGPALKFSWGTPTLVRGELALMLELPAPVRVVLLGSLTASLPTEEHAIVKLGVDVVGEVDFGQKRLAIDASLRGDSHVAGFPITGDMALRLAWGNPPSFALAIGGFHSRFRLPPGFPDLRRVRIPIGSGDDPRLDVEGFLALTSNTAQIGAKVELYASAGPLNITGGFGFETLLVFSPFSLEVDVWGGVALRRGTRILAGLHFDAHVSGPSPWRIDGEACLSLWFIDLCVGIHKTFGTGTPATLAAQEIWGLLRPAVAQPGNWAGEMPAGSRSVASAPPAGEEPVPRVDPGAVLTLRQRVVPLDRTVTRFAHARPQGTDRFEVTELTVGAGAITAPPVRNWSRAAVTDWFAPAEFEEMSEADKLSRPGFERMASGVQAGPEAVRVGDELTCPLVYDTSIYVGGVAQVGPTFQPKTREQLENLGLAINARPPSRTVGAGAYAPAPGTAPLFVLAEETYVIATTDELAPRFDLAAEGSQSEIEAALRAHLVAHPEDAARLQVVPAFDAAA